MLTMEMIQMLLPLIVLQIILMIIGLIDLKRVEETNGPKWLWAIVIILVNIVGPIIYFIFGRRQ